MFAINSLAYIEISAALQNEANFLVGVQMFLKEIFQFILVVRQAVAGTGDLLMMMMTVRINAMRIN